MDKNVSAEKVEQPVHDCTQPKADPKLVDARTESSHRDTHHHYFARNGHGYVGKPAN